MKSLVFSKAHELEIREFPTPTLTAGVVLVRPVYVGLCGTDLELYFGTMPYLAQGVTSYPIRPGHEVAGVVVDTFNDALQAGTPIVVDPVIGCGTCDACRNNRKTHCQSRIEIGVRGGLPGGASELLAVPSDNLHVVPDGVSLRDAVLVEPGVTALNAISRFEGVKSRRALVIGAGTLGLITAQLLVAAGSDVHILDLSNERESLVKSIGAELRCDVVASQYDLVVEASGARLAFNTAIRAVAAGGQVALIGVQDGAVDAVDINSIVLKDLLVFGVLNGPGLYDEFLRQIQQGNVKPGMFVDKEFVLDRADDALHRLQTPGRPHPKVLLFVA